MKNHVWRPLFVVIGLIAAMLLARTFIVPADFGAHERGYMYGWHRKGNEREWQAQTVRYRTAAYCTDCHGEKSSGLAASPHRSIECENCHGPAGSHPDDPPSLAIDRSRELCLRCHARLPYPTSGRDAIPGIEPQAHNPGEACSSCHDPHHPNLEEM
jgi:predicted CXXCH cytochrome family protein